MKVAIIERGKFGGTCVNTGCIPTKTLVASAYAAHVARRGDDYGFTVGGDVRVDMKRVKARKDSVSGRSNKGVEEGLRGLKNCTGIQGHARFGSSRSVWSMMKACRPTKFSSTSAGSPSFPPCRGFMTLHF